MSKTFSGRRLSTRDAPRLRLAVLLWASLAMPCGAAAADAPTAAKPVLRCGWFENPTPGNAWLTDRDGQWIIGTQGGPQAEGDWPQFGPRQWVATNGSYGHGCACLRVLDDAGAKEIRRIVSATARPLATCRRDPALKEPKD